MEFKSFDKILNIGKLWMSVTEKIHGTNAQIMIEDLSGLKDMSMWGIRAGSRTRWLTPEDDNHGFAKWVIGNQEELATKLGEGRHYGEWFGSGINSGYGLKHKMLALFNHRRWLGKDLPANVTTVPELYRGAISFEKIDEIMENLKTQGSRIVPGCMSPEGIVVELDDRLYKKVFDAEETKWTGKSEKPKELKPQLDISHLYQPIRLEKILSRDEALVTNYPESLGEICKTYINDLVAEDQLSADEDIAKAERKALGRHVFYFVKAAISTR